MQLSILGLSDVQWGGGGRRDRDLRRLDGWSGLCKKEDEMERMRRKITRWREKEGEGERERKRERERDVCVCVCV